MGRGGREAEEDRAGREGQEAKRVKRREMNLGEGLAEKGGGRGKRAEEVVEFIYNK